MNPTQLEMRLMPVINRMERRGINLDGPRLKADTDMYWQKLEEIDERIWEILGYKVDVDSNEDLANALEAAGKSKGFLSTPKGRRSVSKESLIGDR